MKEKFKAIFKKLDPTGSVISESVQDELIKIVEEKQTVIKEAEFKKASDLTAKKIEQLDEQHSKMLKKLVEKIDSKYTSKLKTVVEAIDKDHTNKLIKLTKKFKQQAVVNEDSINTVSNFIDMYIEEVMPKAVVVDNAKLKRYEKMYEAVRELLVVNSDEVNGEVKEAILEAKRELDLKSSEIDKLMLEKIELKSQLNKREVEKLLESKTKDMSPKLAAYVTARFKDADSAKIIEEQLNEAVKAFKADEDSSRRKLVEEAKSKSKIKNPIISEDVNSEPRIVQQKTVIDMYANATQKANGNRWSRK